MKKILLMTLALSSAHAFSAPRTYIKGKITGFNFEGGRLQLQLSDSVQSHFEGGTNCKDYVFLNLKKLTPNQNSFSGDQYEKMITSLLYTGYALGKSFQFLVSDNTCEPSVVRLFDKDQ